MADDVFLVADMLQMGTSVILLMLNTKKGHLVSKADIGRDRAQTTTQFQN